MVIVKVTNRHLKNSHEAVTTARSNCMHADNLFFLSFFLFFSEFFFPFLPSLVYCSIVHRPLRPIIMNETRLLSNIIANITK